MVIERNALQTMEGLGALVTVDSYLALGQRSCYSGPGGTNFPCHDRGNESLVSLQGLESLRTVGGDLTIEDNDRLVDVTALYGLVSVGNELKVQYNEALTDQSAWRLVWEIDDPPDFVRIAGNG